MANNTWTLSMLQSFIQNQVEENINLDYKAADALQQTDGKKKEIAKDVSAMANSAGGTIIYGIKEFSDSALKHLPEKVDPIIRANISKEWLEHVINSNVHPKIEGILITPVTVDDLKGTVVYVVDIPQSNTAHQASDKRYYKRYNFESVAMEDYEIRDIMGRWKHPVMALEFYIERQKIVKTRMMGFGPSFGSATTQIEDTEKRFRYRLKIALRNNGKVFANYINYYLEIPSEIVHADENLRDSSIRPNYKEFYGENTIRDILDVKLALPNETFYKYGPSRYDPVLPGTRSRFEKITLINDLSLEDNRILYWMIYADNADIQKGSIDLRDLANNIKETWEE